MLDDSHKLEKALLKTINEEKGGKGKKRRGLGEKEQRQRKRSYPLEH